MLGWKKLVKDQVNVVNESRVVKSGDLAGKDKL